MLMNYYGEIHIHKQTHLGVLMQTLENANVVINVNIFQAQISEELPLNFEYS